MTYTPGLNGGRINLTMGGNSTSAGGGYVLASTGTVLLAGGNNITLSQNGQSVTISGGAAGGGSNTFGMSNIGNTLGTTGMASGSAVQFAYAGGNNVTLSQSINGSSGTITISAFNQSVQTQNLIDVTLAGNSTSAGAGYALASSGTLTLAGGNNVTLSQNGNAVTISAFNQTTQTQNLHNLTLAGNSTSAGAGYIQVSSGTATLAGGNNITLSQNGNAITVSAFNQTVQTQNLVDVTLAGNSTSAGAGYILMSSGSMTLAGGNNITLSQNGNAVTISGGAGGGTQTIGASNLGNTLGTSGVATGTAVQFAFAGGNNVTLSQSINGASGTISIQAPNFATAAAAMAVQFAGNSTSAGAGYSTITSGTMQWAGGNNVTLSQNGQSVTISAGPAPMAQWVHNSAALFSSSTLAMVNTSVSLVRMMIPEQISFSRVDIPVSISGATSASAATAAMALSAVGVIYSRNASTLNAIVGQSSTTTYSYASNTGVYSSITGPRVMSFNLATSLSAGEYYFGFQMSSATSSVGAATTNLGWTVSPIFGTTYSAVPWVDMSSASAATINPIQPMQGMNSVSISNTTQTHQASQVTVTGVTGVRANMIVMFRNA